MVHGAPAHTTPAYQGIYRTTYLCRYSTHNVGDRSRPTFAFVYREKQDGGGIFLGMADGSIAPLYTAQPCARWNLRAAAF